MNIMFLGDSHGDRGFTLSAIRWAAQNEIDRIVQVGDFGFWPRENSGLTFLHDVGKEAIKFDLPFFFIDGNHEDHDRLETLTESPNGPWSVYSAKYPIKYLHRGARVEWGGTTFGFFGGAFSIDRNRRIESSGRYGWFRRELPDESVIPNLGKVDVLITHDSPTVPYPYLGASYKSDDTSRESQATVHRALVESEAKLLIHGHWHCWYQDTCNGATIQGLGMNEDGLPLAVAVYNTDTKTLHKFQEWQYRDAEA